jgi:ADP-ribosylglycohydrolase
MTITPTSLIIDQLFHSSNEQHGIPACQRRYVVASTLEAAILRFDQSNMFDDGVLLAINLGNNAETGSAVTGNTPVLSGANPSRPTVSRD